MFCSLLKTALNSVRSSSSFVWMITMRYHHYVWIIWLLILCSQSQPINQRSYDSVWHWEVLVHAVGRWYQCCLAWCVKSYVVLIQLKIVSPSQLSGKWLQLARWDWISWRFDGFWISQMTTVKPVVMCFCLQDFCWNLYLDDVFGTMVCCRLTVLVPQLLLLFVTVWQCNCFKKSSH